MNMHSSCGSDGCGLTLSFRDGQSLIVPRCALVAASPVLREVLSLPLSTPGVLPLPNDNPEAWHTVSRVLVPNFILNLANWDNLESLLRLADKYDMAVIHGHCCHFLSSSVSCLGLEHPLQSPKNVLRAASLVCTYGSKVEELAPCRKAVLAALNDRLAKLVQKSPSRSCTCGGTLNSRNRCEWACGRQQISSATVASVDEAQRRRLLQLLKDSQYPSLIVSEVQVAVTCAIVEAL